MNFILDQVAEDGSSGKAVLECVEGLIGLRGPVEGFGHPFHMRGIRSAATVLNPRMKCW